MSTGGRLSSIAVACREVKAGFSDLIGATQTQFSEPDLPARTRAIEDVLDRFKLWTGNLGALHEPRSRLSLEKRLGDSPEVLQQIREHLGDLHEALQDRESCKKPRSQQDRVNQIAKSHCHLSWEG